MRHPERQLISLLWTVIAVLVAGIAVGVWLLVHKTDELNDANTDLTNSNASLRRQLREVPTPAVVASPTPMRIMTSPSVTPTPSPVISPTTSSRE